MHVFVTGASGFVGGRLIARLVERGDHFLATVCRQWEEAAAQAAGGGRRAVSLRTGVALGRGGALGKMVPPFRAFVGGPVGSGRQWVSWIHLDDLVGLYLLALDDPR